MGLERCVVPFGPELAAPADIGNGDRAAFRQPGLARVERPVAVIDMTKDLRCPMLGLFGVNDANPTPEHTARMEEELKAHGKTYEFFTFDDAGHAFFWVERPSYNAEAAREGCAEASTRTVARAARAGILCLRTIGPSFDW